MRSLPIHPIQDNASINNTRNTEKYKRTKKRKETTKNKQKQIKRIYVKKEDRGNQITRRERTEKNGIVQMHKWTTSF